MPRRELLSEGQREDLLALPTDEAEFIRRYSLATEDLTRIGRFVSFRQACLTGKNWG